MSEDRFDAIVIGGGPGGYVCAVRLGQLGADVALVEASGLGGVCLQEGCIPSKAIIHAASFTDQAAAARKMGFSFGDVEVDVAELQAWKQRTVDRLTRGVRSLLEGQDVEIIEGTGRVAGPGEVVVETGDGERPIRAKDVVIATGSEAIELPPVPFDGERVISSTGALSLTEAPEKLVVVGGGYIGLELGSALQKLGSDLTIVELMDQLLPGTDAELVEVVRKRLKRGGATIHTGARAKELSDEGLVFETSEGETETLPADEVLVTIGRTPRSEGIGLEDVGVETDDDGFIVVDEQRRTTAEGFWAIGDVAGQPLLAHKASKEGIVCAEAIRGLPSAFDVRCIPWVVFTDPEIAGAGLSPSEAEERGRTVEVGRFPFAALGRAQSTNHTEGFTRITSDADSGEVLGVHIVGAHASDLIAEAALGIEMGAVTEDLALTIHAHPTMAESLMEAAEDTEGRAIHVPSRRRS